MAVLILAMQLAFRNEEEISEFSKLLVLAGLARALFGLVRWAAFGGDPANAYENRAGLSLKLTFFDLNDNLVCWIGLCIAAVQLMRSNQLDYSKLWRLVFWATVVASAACIILSFRRTAWVGLVLGGIFVFFSCL